MSALVALAGCYLVSGHGEVARSMYQHLVEFRNRLNVQLLRMVAAGLSRLHEPHLALEVAGQKSSTLEPNTSIHE